jgi:hypothetical protein
MQKLNKIGACRSAGADVRRSDERAYFNAVCTDVKVVFRLLPVLWTATMMATEMPAAMRPYSIAVAPVSSRKKETSFDMQDSLAECPLGCCGVAPALRVSTYEV